jgi:uncharacterized repeat protein (TIGR02543 family)
MKKLLLTLSIVSLLFACNNGNMEQAMKDPVTIHFDTNGGEPIKSKVIDREITHSVDLPIPKKQGFEFEAWYTDDSFRTDRICRNNMLYVESYPAILGNEFTVYAKFVIYYPVEIDINSVSCDIDPQTGMATFTWKNPSDKDFYRVDFVGRAAVIEPGDTSMETRLFTPTMTPEAGLVRSIIIRCVDKEGNFSKGVEYHITYPNNINIWRP